MNIKKILTLVVLFITTNSYALASEDTLEPVLLINANIVDVKSLKIAKDQSILIEGDKIKRIASTKKLSKVKGASVVDLKGKFVIPGLIDAHVHHATDPDDWDKLSITTERLRYLLRGGVTSVRDMGGDARALAYLKRQAEVDSIASPDIYFSVIIGGESFFSDPRTIASAKGREPGHTVWMRAVGEHSDMDSIMLQAKGAGATGIKIYADVEAETVPLLASAAKKHGLKVWSHAYIGPSKPLQTVNAGVETISHASDISAQLVDNFKEWRRKTAELDGSKWEEILQKDSYLDLFDAMNENGTILDATLTVFEQRNELNEKYRLLDQLSTKMTQFAYQSGITIAAGTDAFSDLENDTTPMIHHELKLLVGEIGMKPLEAIQAATLNAAKVIGIEDSVGSVEEGKKANLVVLSESPEKNIENSKSIVHVVKNGRFIFIGDDPQLPFSSSREMNGTIWLSGQIGNHPSTLTLAGESLEVQMHQTMKNIGQVLESKNLGFDDVVKCTLMLADIDDWPEANKVYIQYFNGKKPARSAFAASGLALDAKAEVECIASRSTD
ncbi:amidohydrolase family protein [Microbulbifer sp. MLAF003]|uniref:amidohydrolase family protein n=1 Tax=Microbulbifer TaxID=48073 RepID=UPI00036EAE09|nr:MULTISPECIES: amidohydrolase family protein [Microbulbifer]WHI49452.1 amidohydrolase family protein [Microbulbifer sp. MLAF003]